MQIIRTSLQPYATPVGKHRYATLGRKTNYNNCINRQKESSKNTLTRSSESNNLGGDCGPNNSSRLTAFFFYTITMCSYKCVIKKEFGKTTNKANSFKHNLKHKLFAIAYAYHSH